MLNEFKKFAMRGNVVDLAVGLVLGAAFGSRANTSLKTELVVLLTLQIVSATGQEVTEFEEGPSVETVLEIEQDKGALVPASYQALVRQSLSDTLEEVLESTSLDPGSLVLSFVLGRNGQLIGTPEVTSPNGTLFIQAGEVSLKAVAPFPPFPPESMAKQVRFRVAVDYHRPGR